MNNGSGKLPELSSSYAASREKSPIISFVKQDRLKFPPLANNRLDFSSASSHFFHQPQKTPRPVPMPSKELWKGFSDLEKKVQLRAQRRLATNTKPN
jgi:hypothetical protein